VLLVGGGVLALIVLLIAAVLVGVNIGRETSSTAPTESEQKTTQAAKPKPDTTKAKAASKTSPEVAVGETATLADGATVTVYSYTPSVPPSNQFSKPKSGNEFSVIDAETCAGNAAMSLNPQSFGLQMPDNSRLDPAFSSAVEPRLNLTNLGTGDCARGYVTFETPQGQTPSFVLFEQPNAPPVKWAV
jgi:hypothetical protein